MWIYLHTVIVDDCTVTGDEIPDPAAYTAERDLEEEVSRAYLLPACSQLVTNL